VKVLAKSMVRLRGQIAKLQSSQAHLRGVGASITTAAATAKVGESMAGASKVMEQFGKVQNPQKVAHTMQQFQKENAKMEMGAEMMDDAMDEIFDTEETEGETDELVGQILDEIGVGVSGELSSAPKKQLNRAQQDLEIEGIDDDLAERLAQLKA